MLKNILKSIGIDKSIGICGIGSTVCKYLSIGIGGNFDIGAALLIITVLISLKK